MNSPGLVLHFIIVNHCPISDSLGAMTENVIFPDFGPKIGHFDMVTIATGTPISFWLLIYLHSHAGYMIRAFNEQYSLLSARRTPKTSIFGEFRVTSKVQRSISRKRLELGQIWRNIGACKWTEFSNSAIFITLRPLIKILYGKMWKKQPKMDILSGLP